MKRNASSILSASKAVVFNGLMIPDLRSLSTSL